jgi:hypothetical protein
MSTDRQDWEAAARPLLKSKAETVGQDVTDALAPLRMLDDDGLDVPRGTAQDIRVAIANLETLADAVEAADADVPADSTAKAEAIKDNS